MASSDAGSGSSEEVILYQCRKCNDGKDFSAAELDAHRQTHRKGGRGRKRRPDTQSGTTFVRKSGSGGKKAKVRKERPKEKITSDKIYDKNAEKKTKNKKNPGA